MNEFGCDQCIDLKKSGVNLTEVDEESFSADYLPSVKIEVMNLLVKCANCKIPKHINLNCMNQTFKVNIE